MISAAVRRFAVSTFAHSTRPASLPAFPLARIMDSNSQTSKLSSSQQETLRKFATLTNAESLGIDPRKATAGDVLQSILRFGAPSAAEAGTVAAQLEAAQETEVQRNYREKYREKLLKKAQEEGYDSVEDMLEKKKAAEELRNRQLNARKPSQEDKQDKKDDTRVEPKKAALPSYAKKLNDIVKIDLLMNESAETIGSIWNKFHATKDCLSASLDAQLYSKLYQRGRQFPIFVLPLPRNGGYELYFMQFSGHQIYYTTLLEYKTHGTASKPSLVLTHFDDLAEAKSIVLMVGELGDGLAKNSNLSLVEAQNLVYQTQLFYITGTPEQMALVEKMSKDPSSFDYQDLIKAVETLR
eukprot:jgi/Hompol1/5883/HPOL_000182-RA